MYFNMYYWGMNLLWWTIWLIVLFWIFATPYDIPGQRKKNEDPLTILQKRFAAGLINTEEYNDKKKLLEKDIAKV